MALKAAEQQTRQPRRLGWVFNLWVCCVLAKLAPTGATHHGRKALPLTILAYFRTSVLRQFVSSRYELVLCCRGLRRRLTNERRRYHEAQWFRWLVVCWLWSSRVIFHPFKRRFSLIGKAELVGCCERKGTPKFDFSLLESPKTAVFRSFEAFFILLRVVFEGRHAIKIRQPASMAQFRRFGFPKRLKSNLEFRFFLEPHLHRVAYPLQFIFHCFLCHRTQLKHHRWATH